MQKNGLYSNIHTSDKLEIFFGGRVFSAAKEAVLFTMHGESDESLMHWSAALTKKNAYTPWVKAKSAAFTSHRVTSGSSQYSFPWHSRLKMGDL